MRALVMMVAMVGCKGTPTGDATCESGPVETWRDNEVPAVIQQAFEDELAQTTAHGVSYAILVDGEIRYAGAVGDRDRRDGLPMTPETLLRGGSTLKMQTSALLLSLEGEGLERSDTLGMHLPEFSMASAPGVAEQATLHQLMSHQGGFMDHTPIDGPAGEFALYSYAHNTYAAEFGMLTEPGNFYNYSNPNFGLAGLVSQEVGGEPYADLMRTRLWDPLCMHRTTFDAEEVENDGDYAVARSTFDANGEQRIEPDAYDHGFSRPAGFAWTSAPDMLRFAHFLLEGNEGVMPAATSRAITEAHVDTLDVPGGILQYGYGIDVREAISSVGGWMEGPILSHGGDIPGFAADLWIHEPSGVAVAILANGDGAHFTVSALTALEELGDMTPTSAPDLSPATDLDAFVGTYSDPDNVGDFIVSLNDDGQLAISAPRLDDQGLAYPSTLVGTSGDRFAFSIGDDAFTFTFVRNEAGVPTWIRHRAFVAERSTP